MVNSKIKYATVNTPAGWIGILSSEKGLLRITLPQGSSQEAQQLLSTCTDNAISSPHLFENLARRLIAYFSGYEVLFPDRLDLSGATTFRREVWEKTRPIPYGQTRSYSWVAEQIGKPGAARAVGQALSRNPLPIIIPCHRVTTADGELGGYSGGLEMKRHLLSLEASHAELSGLRVKQLGSPV